MTRVKLLAHGLALLCLVLTLNNCSKDEPLFSNEELQLPDAQIADYNFHTINLSELESAYLWLGDVQPGDRVKFTGEFKGRLVLNGLKGTKDRPIRLYGNAKVTSDQEWALILNGSQYINLSELSLNRGLATWGDCTDLNLHHLNIVNDGNGSVGMMIKNDQAGREYPYYQNIVVHHNYIANFNTEGMYIGRFTYMPSDIYESPYGHTLKNLKVYNNFVENCGWDGIQVGCADENALITDNKMIGNATKNQGGQNFGLCVNSGFQGVIQNNEIIERNGTGGGVQLMPFSTTRFVGNVVYAPSADQGIFIRTEPNYGEYMHTDPQAVVSIYNNEFTVGRRVVYLYDNEVNGETQPLHDLRIFDNKILGDNDPVILDYKDKDHDYVVQ